MSVESKITTFQKTASGAMQRALDEQKLLRFVLLEDRQTDKSSQRSESAPSTTEEKGK